MIYFAKNDIINIGFYMRIDALNKGLMVKLF